MSKEQETDWEGMPVPEDESPDTIVSVWTCSPHIGNPGYDEYWERSHQKFLSYIEVNLDTWLANHMEDELRDGTALKIRLRRMRLETYQEAIEATV